MTAQKFLKDGREEEDLLHLGVGKGLNSAADKAADIAKALEDS